MADRHIQIRLGVTRFWLCCAIAPISVLSSFCFMIVGRCQYWARSTLGKPTLLSAAC